VAAIDYRSRFEDDCFNSFHDQERVSRISGIVPVDRRRGGDAPSLRIPRDARSNRPSGIVMIGLRTPPLSISYAPEPRPRKIVPLLLSIAAFLMLTIAASFAHYL
jgi:hypothetical protein